MATKNLQENSFKNNEVKKPGSDSNQAGFFDKIREVAMQISGLARWPFLLLIRLYQHTLSPDHGPLKRMFPYGYCRFQPSCSEYGYQVIKKHGIIIGGIKAGWRILRCNPWSDGGEDRP